MDVMAITKVLGQKDMDRIPSDILKKLKKQYQTYNDRFIQMKDEAEDNMDKVRKLHDHIKSNNKTYRAEISQLSNEQNELRKILDDKNSEISRLYNEKDELQKILDGKDSLIKRLQSEKEVLQKKPNDENVGSTELAATEQSLEGTEGINSDGVATEQSREDHEQPNAGVVTPLTHQLSATNSRLSNELEPQAQESFSIHIDPEVDLWFKNCYGDHATVNSLQETVDVLEKELQLAVTEKDNATSHLRDMNLEIVRLNNDISKLKCELNAANDLLKTDENDTEKVLEKVFPRAAEANRLLKDNLSLTDIFNKYYSSLDDVQSFEVKCLQLNTKLAQITSQHRETSFEFENRKIEYEKLLKLNEDLNQKNINSTKTQDCIRKRFDETMSKLGIVERENSQLKCTQNEMSMQLMNMLSKLKTYPDQLALNQEQGMPMSTNKLEASSTKAASDVPQHQNLDSSGYISTSETMRSPQNTSVQSTEVVDQNQSRSRKRPHADDISSSVKESSGVLYSADEDARKCSMMMLNRAKLALKIQQKKQQEQNSKNSIAENLNGSNDINEKRSPFIDRNVSSDERSSSDDIGKSTAHKKDQQLSLDQNKRTDQTKSNFNNPSTEQNFEAQPSLLHHHNLSNHSNIPRSDINFNEYGLQYTDKHQNYRDTGCCVRVTNMNNITRYHAIRYFFNGLDIPKFGIKLLYDANRRRKNEAAICFAGPQIASKALEWDGKLCDGYSVNVLPISDRAYKNEVDLHLPPAHINTGSNRHRNIVAGNQGEFQENSRDVNRNNNVILITDLNNGKINNRRASVQINYDGCIVSLKNVPVEATPEDVDHFFGKFNLGRNNIVRKINADGSLSPYVRVRFQTRMDALEAIKRYHGERIRDNVIHLSLVT